MALESESLHFLNIIVGMNTNNLPGLSECVRIAVSVTCQGVEISENCQNYFIREQVRKRGEVGGGRC